MQSIVFINCLQKKKHTKNVMKDLIKEYGKKRVYFIKKFYSNILDIELCLDAWKEYSVNPDFFIDKSFSHEFDKYENLVKNLKNYFES